MTIRSVCVFCGSSSGGRASYHDAARAFGHALAAKRRTLVYGGGNVGLMGVIADAALAEGGRVIGVMPQHLVDREVAHTGLTELRVVSSMHERKQAMADLADAFALTPGGLGSLEEFFEVWTWGRSGEAARAARSTGTAHARQVDRSPEPVIRERQMTATNILDPGSAVPRYLLKETRLSDLTIIRSLSGEDDGVHGIRCPRCQWRPSESSRWSCIAKDAPEPDFDGCGTTWNTFATRGRCPGCQHQWQWTSCLRCAEWSPHVEWYEREGRE